MVFVATQHRATVKAPIGKTVVIGSFENHRSGTDITVKKKTPRKKIQTPVTNGRLTPPTESASYQRSSPEHTPAPRRRRFHP